jgi:hypothetical protein
MQAKHETLPGIGHQPVRTTSKAPTRDVSVFGRRLAAAILGVVLLALSALIHAAAAATIGATWISLGATWTIAILIILLAVYGARTSIVAWRRMCLINGIASLTLLAVGAAEFASQAAPSQSLRPFGPVIGVAVASAMLAISGLVFALLFFLAWHLLPRHHPRRRLRPTS